MAKREKDAMERVCSQGLMEHRHKQPVCLSGEDVLKSIFIFLFRETIDVLQLQAISKWFYDHAIPGILAKWDLPLPWYLACPEVKRLRKTLLCQARSFVGKPLRVVDDRFNFSQSRCIQIANNLYSLSYSNPMQITMYQDPQSTHTLKISQDSDPMCFRGFALACWKERYLYITGGFAAGEQENNYVSELDLVELD